MIPAPSAFLAARNCTTLPAGLGVPRAASPPHAYITRRRCCPTARCWWQGDLISAATLASAELYDVGLGFVRPDWQPQITTATSPLMTWQQPHADRLAFPRHLPSFRRKLPGLIDQLPRCSTTQHRQQPGRLSSGGSNGRLV